MENTYSYLVEPQAPYYVQSYPRDHQLSNEVQLYPYQVANWYPDTPPPDYYTEKMMANAPQPQPQPQPPAPAAAAPAHVTGEAAPPAKTHQRAYQACHQCRERKVKCHLGHPDEPQPPCSRCRREGKRCTFAATRRKTKAKSKKRKADQEDEDDSEDQSRPRSASSKYARTEAFASSDEQAPRTPAGSKARTRPLRRPSAGDGPVDVDQDQEEDPAINDDTAEMLQKSELYSGPDAMAALASIATAPARAAGTPNRPASSSAKDSSNLFSRDNTKSSPAYGPATTSMDGTANGTSATLVPSEHESPASHSGVDASRVWARLRFVRAGLFTASEGIAYVQYFYRYLNPLTPITVPRYQDTSTHARLLLDEPILAVTMLTIASRYMKLSGPGAETRAFTIHEKLWVYLKAQIQRVYFGQEQSGGGFCGAGSRLDFLTPVQTSLRSLGTVESLLLLTEWHARAIHFPPGADSEELLDEDFRQSSFNGTAQNTAGGQSANPAYQIDHWLEPCWRSDRMVWSLLSSAICLAAELGVFTPASDVSNDDDDDDAYGRRRENVRLLIYIYVTQTSGRLSLPSLLPPSFSTGFFAGGPPEVESEPYRHEYVHGVTLYFWHGIARLFQDTNAKLFASKDMTRRIISDGSYVELLQEFNDLARAWRTEFTACKAMPAHMRHILNIEYEYSVVYVNSIGLTAFVERCARSTGAGSDGVIPPAALLKSLEGDRKYLDAILTAGKNMLLSVVRGLLPKEYLKHAPARTYIRIIAVSMMLLKAIALGAANKEARTCISLLHEATNALRTCVVDDVHVSTSVAGLIEILTQRAAARLIRIQTKKDATSDRPIRRASRATGQANGQDSAHADRAASASAAAAVRPTGSIHGQADASPALSNSGSLSMQTQPYAFSPFVDTSTMPAFDPMNPNFIIMPPAEFNASDGLYGSMAYENFDSNGIFSSPMYDGSVSSNTPSLSNANINTTSGAGGAGSSSNDWVALPLDALFNGTYANDVTQTGYGPDIGGRDMLNLLLMDDPVDLNHTS